MHISVCRRTSTVRHEIKSTIKRSRSTIENSPGVILANQQYHIPKGAMGQPTCHTHPHLISPDHLTSGVTQAEYKDRRDIFVHKLVAEIQNEHKTHIVSI